MRDITKYQGIIPAFYACYEEDGSISTERTKALAEHLLKKGVKGVYVGGSSGECIYQSKEERKAVLEAVMETVKGKMTVIAHVACNNTEDSCELAAHAESLGVDAVASIPPSILNIWISCTGMELFFTAATLGFLHISLNRGMVRATPASCGML